MNEAQYKSAIKEIEREMHVKKSQLAAKYAKTNRKHKIGDIVTDHIGSILVEKIMFTNGYSSLPDSVYEGPILTKQNKPRKDGKVRDVYQFNIITQGDK